MALTPGIRKLALTSHVIFSVGWLGAVAAFFVLAVAGSRSVDLQLVRSVYVAAELTTWWMIVPLCFASLLSGLLVSLGTHWGLFRHYWVVAKLGINLLATLLLLLHTGPIGEMARLARASTWSDPHLEQLQGQLVFDASAALAALLVATFLAVYKPVGLTPYGRRQQVEAISVSGSHTTSTRASEPATPHWVMGAGILTFALLLVVVYLHLTGRGMGGHQ